MGSYKTRANTGRFHINFKFFFDSLQGHMSLSSGSSFSERHATYNIHRRHRKFLRCFDSLISYAKKDPVENK